jgi:hypothetical protein
MTTLPSLGPPWTESLRFNSPVAGSGKEFNGLVVRILTVKWALTVNSWKLILLVRAFWKRDVT